MGQRATQSGHSGSLPRSTVLEKCSTVLDQSSTVREKCSTVLEKCSTAARVLRGPETCVFSDIHIQLITWCFFMPLTAKGLCSGRNGL